MKYLLSIILNVAIGQNVPVGQNCRLSKMAVGQKFCQSKWLSVKNSVGQKRRRSKLPSVKKPGTILNNSPYGSSPQRQSIERQFTAKI
jgi:hypothetical protein